jgi:hypothetical protein
VVFVLVAAIAAASIVVLAWFGRRPYRAHAGA